MESAPDAGDTKDFAFEKLAELSVWDPEKEQLLSSVVRAVSVTNRFGFVCCICENGFYIVNIAAGDPFLNTKTKDTQRKSLDQFGGSFKVTLAWQPYFVAFSGSGLTLAVVVPRDGGASALLYDTRAFARKDPSTAPYNIVRLSSAPQTSVVDFGWIPLAEETFVAVLSDGSFGLYTVQGSTTNIVGQLGAATQAKCVSWSPKGKQLVIGKQDGTIVQYKPDLTVARTIPGPSQMQVEVKNITWLSTYVFAVGYIKPGDQQPTFAIVHAPKTGNPVFTSYGDICNGFSEHRPLSYFLLPILDWNIVLIASNTALETAVLACQSQDGTTGWLQLNLEETARAELPMVGDEDTYPLGIALVTCVPEPMLLISSTHGIVVAFRVKNTLVLNGNRPANICSSPELVSAVPGEYPQMKLPSVQPASAPAATPIPFPQLTTPSPSFSFGPAAGTSNSATVAAPSFSFGNPSGSTFSMPISEQKTSESAPKPSLLQGLLASTTPSFPASQSVSVAKSDLPVPTAGVSSAVCKPKAEPSTPLSKTSSMSRQEPPKSPVVPTAVISSKPTVAPMQSPAPSRTIPSAPLKAFLAKVNEHCSVIREVSVAAPVQEDRLKERTDALVDAVDRLIASYNDSLIHLGELESSLEERLGVVGEAKVVLEKCADPEFIQCLKLLPLDPIQRKKYESLKESGDNLRHRVESMNVALDIELDIREGMPPEEYLKRVMSDVEMKSLKLEKRLRELEMLMRRLPVSDSSRTEPSSSRSDYSRMLQSSPFRKIYPDLTKEMSRKVDSVVSSNLLRKLKSRPMRVTKHPIVIFDRSKPPSEVPESPSSSSSVTPSKGMKMEHSTPLQQKKLEKPDAESFPSTVKTLVTSQSSTPSGPVSASSGDGLGTPGSVTKDMKAAKATFSFGGSSSSPMLVTPSKADQSSTGTMITPANIPKPVGTLFGSPSATVVETSPKSSEDTVKTVGGPKPVFGGFPSMPQTKPAEAVTSKSVGTAVNSPLTISFTGPTASVPGKAAPSSGQEKTPEQPVTSSTSATENKTMPGVSSKATVMASEKADSTGSKPASSGTASSALGPAFTAASAGFAFGGSVATAPDTTTKNAPVFGIPATGGAVTGSVGSVNLGAPTIQPSSTKSSFSFGGPAVSTSTPEIVPAVSASESKPAPSEKPIESKPAFGGFSSFSSPSQTAEKLAETKPAQSTFGGFTGFGAAQTAAKPQEPAPSVSTAAAVPKPEEQKPVQTSFTGFGAPAAATKTGESQPAPQTTFGAFTGFGASQTAMKLQEAGTASVAVTPQKPAQTTFGGFGASQPATKPQEAAAPSVAATPQKPAQTTFGGFGGFGGAATAQKTDESKTALPSFGALNLSQPKPEEPKPAASPFGSFGGFGSPSAQPKPEEPKAASSPFTGFGMGSTPTQQKPEEPKPPASTFGSFGGFGSPQQPPAQQPQTSTSQVTSSFGGFGFGGGSVTPATPQQQPPSVSAFGGFGSPAQSTPQGSSGPFGGFGQPANQPAPSVSSFGGFNVGASATPAPNTGSGFGSFSGFGAKPAFGSPSGFGQPAAFGSSPAGGFGTAPAFGGTLAPAQPAAFGAGSSGFGNFGGFASYAQQGGGASFGALAAQTQQPQPAPTGFGGFGSGAPSAPSTGQAPQFTQYR